MAQASGNALSSSGSASALGVVVAADTTPPTLTVTSPQPGQMLGGRSLTLSATASDASGVASVAFYFDGKLVAQPTIAPYSANLTLRKVAIGLHTVTVMATDKFNNVSQQDIVVNK